MAAGGQGHGERREGAGAGISQAAEHHVRQGRDTGKQELSFIMLLKENYPSITLRHRVITSRGTKPCRLL